MAAPAEENHVGNHVGFEDEEDDLEDTEDSDMEEYEDDFAATPVPVVSINPNPNPNPPLGQHNGSIIVQPLSSSSADPKESKPPVTPAPARPASASASLDESRRLFQRLWTDDDEIKILSGFLEFTSSRGTTFASHQYDTGPFYEQIKNQLQLDFNKNQLIEKLRRLKKKYRNTAARMASHGKEFSFKSPHERATYEIARRIWSVGSSGSGIKRSRESDDDDLNPYSNSNNSFDAAAATSERRTARSRRRGRKRALETIPVAPVPLMLPAPPIAAPPVLAGPSEGVVKVEVQTTPTPIIPPMPSSSTALPPPPPPPIPSIVEETVKGCLSPILKELLNSAVRGSIGSGLNGFNGGVGFGIMGLGPPPVFSFGGHSVNSSAAAAAGDEKWKKQQILELEVYLKRVELVRDQIKSTLEELKSSEPKAAAAVPTPAAPNSTTGS